MLGSVKILFLFVFLFVIACSQPDPSFSLLADTEAFLQNKNEINTKIDVLFVIDNSLSMRSSQEALIDNFGEFLDGFSSRNFDFQMAVITTEAYRSLDIFTGDSSWSRFRDETGLNNYIVTPATPDFENIYLTNLLQGTSGTGDERAFSSIKESFNNPLNQDFLREDSFLAIILVSDEDDFSHDGANFINDSSDTNLHNPNIYKDYLDQLTNSSDTERRYSVSAMAIWDTTCQDTLNDSWMGRKIGVRMGALVNMTDGEKGSLCGNFADDLNFISEGIIQLATQFYLARIPVPETIKVLIDNNELPMVTNVDKPVDGWLYNEQNNSVIFFGTAVPIQGANINIVYDPVSVGQ